MKPTLLNAIIAIFLFVISATQLSCKKNLKSDFTPANIKQNEDNIDLNLETKIINFFQAENNNDFESFSALFSEPVRFYDFDGENILSEERNKKLEEYFYKRWDNSGYGFNELLFPKEAKYRNNFKILNFGNRQSIIPGYSVTVNVEYNFRDFNNNLNSLIYFTAFIFNHEGLITDVSFPKINEKEMFFKDQQWEFDLTGNYISKWDSYYYGGPINVVDGKGYMKFHRNQNIEINMGYSSKTLLFKGILTTPGRSGFYDYDTKKNFFRSTVMEYEDTQTKEILKVTFNSKAFSKTPIQFITIKNPENQINFFTHSKYNYKFY